MENVPSSSSSSSRRSSSSSSSGSGTCGKHVIHNTDNNRCVTP